MVCAYCKDEAEPGRIETDNNGPILPCPVCSPREPSLDASALAILGFCNWLLKTPTRPIEG